MFMIKGHCSLLKPLVQSILRITMFFKKGQIKDDTKDSTVLVVKETYWRSLMILRQSDQLYLCQTKDDGNRIKYEIVYKAAKIFSLCRIQDHDIALDRFECLRSISNVMFHPTNPHRNTSYITQAFQKVVNTAVEHPNWRDVHISAYNGYVDFFHKANLSSEEINAQQPPDLCTPLHLAILQGFSVTMEAILGFNPDITLLDSENNSILHYAALSKVDILDKVLQLTGIHKLHFRNNKQWNPVELAFFNLKKDNLQCLLTHGLTVRMLSLVAEPGKPIDCGHQKFLDCTDNDRLVTFTKVDLEELDLGSTDQGGCPLHWATGSHVIEKLIRDEFNIDTLNLNSETALNVMVKRNRAKCALSLLYNGADPNKPDVNGDTPAHIAVKCGNVHLLKTLLVFDANANALDANEHSVRHLAATGTHPNNPEMLAMLMSIGASPCESSSASKCAKGCVTESPKSGQNPNWFEHAYPFNYSPNHRMLANEILREVDISPTSDQSTSVNGKPKGKKVMMICFDGGGVKGLFTVQMMIELSKYLKEEFSQYFDWISGTSTGAMIAFSLTKGKSLAELRKLYFIFKDEIMTGSRPYNETQLESLFHSELGGNMRMCDALSTFGKHVVLAATRVDRSPPSLHLFRSYSYPGVTEISDSGANIAVWKALRASAAAPTYFKSFPPYIDGGMVANNPTLDSLTEFLRYQAAIRKYNCRHEDKPIEPSDLKLLLSFGNGQVRRCKKDLAEMYNRLYYLQNLRSLFRDLRALSACSELVSQIKSIVTNCNDNVVFRADSWCSAVNTAFFRLNPVLSKKMSLNETDDVELMKGLWEVKLYAFQNAQELQQLAQVIDCLHNSRRRAFLTSSDTSLH